MTEQQKSDIIKLRKKGTAFSAIAEQLSLSINTVKSFYRRNSTADKQSMLPTCKYCGKRLIQPYGKREKKYCSDKCRFLWWNGHRNELKKKTVCIGICFFCGVSFNAYKSAKRKYCCRDCYYKARYGVMQDVRKVKE